MWHQDYAYEPSLDSSMFGQFDPGAHQTMASLRVASAVNRLVRSHLERDIFERHTRSCLDSRS